LYLLREAFLSLSIGARQECLVLGMQEASSSSTAGGLPSDLAILSMAANQLFESTQDMSTETVINILSGLRLVSNRALPAAALAPGQPKCAPHPQLLQNSFSRLSFLS
jgi:hypothetical protein